MTLQPLTPEAAKEGSWDQYKALTARIKPGAAKLVSEYRPTMPFEVLHLWAADAVETLARVKQLEDALRPFAATPVPLGAKPHHPINYQPVAATYADVLSARAALNEGEG